MQLVRYAELDVLCICSAEEEREHCLWILLLIFSIYIQRRGEPHREHGLLFLMPHGDQGSLGFSCPSFAACSPGLLCHRVSVDMMASIIQGNNLIALLHQ